MLKILIKKILQICRIINIEIIHRFNRKVNVYDSCEAAKASLKNNGYANDELIQNVLSKYKKVFFKNSKFLKNLNTYDLNVTRTLIPVLLSRTREQLNVIDFGGSFGIHYLIARNFLGKEISIKWNVVEQAKIKTEAEKHFANNDLKFFDSIDKAKVDLGIVDLVFTSCTLCYLENPIEQLQDLIKINAKYLCICRNPLNEESEEDIFATQETFLEDHGPGELPCKGISKKANIAITILSKTKLENELLKKYDIKFSHIEERNAHYAKNKKIHNFFYFCVLKN
jgi:putative methyltransferase (TIGR04325 family)